MLSLCIGHILSVDIVTRDDNFLIYLQLVTRVSHNWRESYYQCKETCSHVFSIKILSICQCQLYTVVNLPTVILWQPGVSLWFVQLLTIRLRWIGNGRLISTLPTAAGGERYLWVSEVIHSNPRSNSWSNSLIIDIYTAANVFVRHVLTPLP